jgi:hypothetical protein
MKVDTTSVQTHIAQRCDVEAKVDARSAQTQVAPQSDVDAALRAPAATLIEQQARALLELIEADRASKCALILGEANSRAAAVRAQASADARTRMRRAFEEQRQLQRERVAAAQARLATHRRLHEQQRTAALLRLAWEQLPGELLALWRQPGSRANWVAHVLASARARMPKGPWQIVHAPDWPAAERQALAQGLAAESGVPPRFEDDADIPAGLKVIAKGNVIDGTLGGLLADRAEFEAQLLRQLEPLT